MGCNGGRALAQRAEAERALLTARVVKCGRVEWSAGGWVFGDGRPATASAVRRAGRSRGSPWKARGLASMVLCRCGVCSLDHRRRVRTSTLK